MAMPTRIETRHRPTKRPMAKVTFDINGSVLTIDSERARMPGLDEKAYSTKSGVPDPTLVAMTVVDTTP